MIGSFTLFIDLGDAAMQTPQDVVSQLLQIATKIEDDGQLDGRIIDRNGNTVGRYAFTDESEA